MDKLRHLRWWPRSRIKQFVYALLSFTVIWTQLFVLQPVEAGVGIRGSATTNTGTATASITVNKPTGVIADDVMIASIVTSGNVTPALTGWTQIDQLHSGFGNYNLTTLYKRAGTSEGASYAFAWTGNQTVTGAITAFKGITSTSNPIDNSGAAHSINQGTTSAIDSPAVTTNTANAMIFATYVLGNASSGINTMSPNPANANITSIAEQYDVTNGSTFETSGDTATDTGTGSTNALRANPSTLTNWMASTIALTPANPSTLNQADYRWAVNADNTNPTFIQDNLSANDDHLNGTVDDSINSYFYAVGDNNSNWVIEKRRTADGALCTSTNCGTTFGTAGRVTEDIASSTSEKAYAVALDPNGGYIYVAGMDSITGAGEWRIEKRNTSDGSLVSGWGTNGIVESNTSSSLDEPTSVLYDNVNGYLYVGGYDGTGNNQWSLQKYRGDNGNICTAANCGTQFGTNGIYSYNASNSDDRISYLEIDPTNTYLYVSGYSTANNGRTQWTVQKMLASSAALCSGATCGGVTFGTAGTYNSDPTNKDDKVLTMQVDDAAGAIYLGGSEQSGTSASNWRIEKITLDTGTLVTAFGGSGCASNVAGALCTSFSSGFDKVYDMQIDGAGGYLYVLGVVDESGTNTSWRLQKRNRSDGSLVSAWATSGTATIDPSTNADPPSRIVLDVDRSLLWVTGGDRSLGTTNMQWYYVPLNIDTGTYWMAAVDTVAVSSTQVSFRLRLLLGVSGDQMVNGAQNLKLQYSPKVGTCDTSFVGESYQDVPTSGNNEILYHSNPTVTDGTNAVALSGDPTDGTNPTVMESIEEANNFTNSANDIPRSSDGEWDFVLNDNLAFGPYCFRVLDSSGSQIATYTQVPEITFCKNDPKTDNLLRHGTYFCGGTKKGFFWAN